jgi:hypothetical protein
VNKVCKNFPGREPMGGQYCVAACSACVYLHSIYIVNEVWMSKYINPSISHLGYPGYMSGLRMFLSPCVICSIFRGVSPTLEQLPLPRVILGSDDDDDDDDYVDRNFFLSIAICHAC